MRITPPQLMLIEKSIVELYNRLKENKSLSLTNLNLDNSFRVGYLSCSLEEAKEYLDKKFFSHPILRLNIIDDLFLFVTSNVSNQSNFSEEESNQITGIKEIVQRRGYFEV